MPFYYREIQDPNNPEKVVVQRIADDEADLHDLIYQMPGGIYQFDRLKLIYSVFSEVLKDSFDNNQTIETGNGKFVPEPFRSQYDDELLAQIEKANHKTEVDFVPNDPDTLAELRPIKVEGEFVPERIEIEKIIDHSAIPPMLSVSKESMQKQRQIENDMPFIKQIKQGGIIRILGNHLKIRPNSKRDEGLFFINDSGHSYELTDFLEVNSIDVLLLAIPLDFPLGSYNIYIRSGWFADPTVLREGTSSFSIKIVE